MRKTKLYTIRNNMKELKLIPPTDPRVQTAIAPFTDDMLKEHDFKDRKELNRINV